MHVHNTENKLCIIVYIYNNYYVPGVTKINWLPYTQPAGHTFHHHKIAVAIIMLSNNLGS